MKLTKNEWLHDAGRQMMKNPIVVATVVLGLLAMALLQVAGAQSFSTTTVQGTMYLASGQAATGTLRVSWPAFTTANGQAVAAGSSTVTIAPDGFVSMNLAPNVGATPAGLFYTAIFYMSDGTTNTQYWVVPAAAQASLAQVQSKVMPAAQAVQAVSKAYVDQTISTLSQSMVTASGGSLSGPLYLNSDPTQPLQAADKHYVDTAVSQVAPITLAPGSAGQIAYYTGNGSAIGGMSTVPLAAGGTGSATAAGALQNLGGISTTATSQQTITGPVSANVNGTYAITVFGAKGDCTGNGPTSGCTDNSSAIQNAINAAYITGASVLLPTNPSATGPTVYYVGATLNPKGVSIFSNAGAGRNVGGGGFWPNVAVRGAPGKDVFAPGDPTSPGYVAPLNGFTVRDIGIIVDDSIDVSSTLGAHRKPGKTCFDVLATSSSTVVTSNTCEFQPGDVGQNITLTDGTNTLSTTIASIGLTGSLYATTATLAASWTHATHANSTMYVSVMGMPTLARVGNCAWAYDDTSTGGVNGISPAAFSDLTIVTTSTTWQNNSCAFFMQGPAGQPYDTVWSHVFNRTYWGYVAVPADNLTSGNGAFGDYNVVEESQNQSMVPWLTYNGDWTTVRAMQTSTARWGPQILLTGGGPEIAPNNWTVDNIELEEAGVSLSGGGWRVSGTNQIVRNSWIGAAPYAMPAQWDADASKCENCFSNGQVNVTGFLNAFSFGDDAGELVMNDTGFKNSCKALRQFNPFDASEPAVPTTCAVVNSRQTNAFAHTAEFVANGDETAPYNNQADLWVWPADMDTYGTALPVIVADAASESGQHGMFLNGTGGAIAYLNGKAIIVGQSGSPQANLPPTKNHMCFRAKADSGSGSVTFSFQAPLQTTTLGSVSPSLSTSYGTYCFDADLTGLSGDSANFNISTSTVNVDLAWISVHPWSQQTNTYGLNVAGGTAMTANHGTGTSLQHSDGTGTSGVCFFTADGSCTAKAGALQSGTTATTESAGDNSTKVATDAFVLANAPSMGAAGRTPYGTIFSANTTSSPTLAGSLSSFTSNGVTPANSGGALVFTGGPGNWTQSIDYNYNTQLPIWTMDATYTVGTPGPATYGIGFGLRSNAASGNYQPVTLYMDSSNTASSGGVYLNNGPSHTQIAPASPEVVSFSGGDTIRVYLTRVYDTVSGFVLDVNTGSIANVIYQYAFNSSATGATNSVPNIGTFSIYNLGGTQTVTSLKISSGLPKGADIACIGDSKTVGYWAGTFASGWCMQLQASYKAYQLASGYGESADLLANVPEIIALAPKYAIVMTGGNDRRYSVSLATTESNIATAVSALQAAGITVYVATYPVENSGVSMASLNSWIVSTYPTNSIDINNGFSQTGSGVPATWLNVDGIHPSGYFHSSIAQQIATRLQRDSAKQQFPFYVTP